MQNWSRRAAVDDDNRRDCDAWKQWSSMLDSKGSHAPRWALEYGIYIVMAVSGWLQQYSRSIVPSDIRFMPSTPSSLLQPLHPSSLSGYQRATPSFRLRTSSSPARLAKKVRSTVSGSIPLVLREARSQDPSPTPTTALSHSHPRPRWPNGADRVELGPTLPATGRVSMKPRRCWDNHNCQNSSAPTPTYHVQGRASTQRWHPPTVWAEATRPKPSHLEKLCTLLLAPVSQKSRPSCPDSLFVGILAGGRCE